MLNSRRSTPMSDGYAGSPVNRSVDSYSQRSASDGRQSISSSTYSPVSRQPVNSWTPQRTGSTGLASASSPNAVDSLTKSTNPALRASLPADYKPSGYGTGSRTTNIRSNSSSNTSLGSESQPRSARSPVTAAASTELSAQTEGRFSRAGDHQNYGSLTRRHSRTYDGSRVNGSGRRSSRHYEPRVSPNQSSEWQVKCLSSAVTICQYLR